MIEDVIKLSEAYVSYTGLRPSTVSTYAANDGKWLVGLMEGTAGCTIRKANRVIQWYSDNWPTDLAWPAGVRRPAKSKVAA